ncbi:hypothetical protein ciss_07170 [Carboxydothermus islandicus]|uniref:Uncharacterized protein n=1 Tax=Carboxydothermus islandicus TaxID=661089 RepID=A0A1L8D0W6_9THEO|nr:hypothetical protein ciss_07170 [Carboxydothermus islandicus]
MDCLNANKYGCYCEYMGHFQQGGGSTSEYSYIYCEYLGVEVRVDPVEFDFSLKSRNIKPVIHLPEDCPHKKVQLTLF